MAFTATLTVHPTSPSHGDTVTAAYVVSGNDGTPAAGGQVETISGQVVVGDQPVNVSTTLTLPGTPAVPPLPEAYSPPVVAGLTFTATGVAGVFTALVP